MAKNILIAGANSYIGETFKEYLEQWPEQYSVSVLETKGLKPTPAQFTDADTVFCVAGIAHIKENAENRHLYFDINQNLVIEIARNAKAAKVGQFIILSSMSVYGLEEGYISKETKPNPMTAYGESKYRADVEIKKMEDDRFKFCCLRPPMVYGRNCTGHYRELRRFALKSFVFPNYMNKRSMIYIGNLCEFVKQCIDEGKNGLFFPQNSSYTNTCEMVKQIALEHGKKIQLTKAFNWAIRICPLNVVKKVFSDLVYEPVDMVEKYRFNESIRLTEGTIDGK